VILFLGLQQEVQGSKELEKYSFAAQTAAEKAALEALSTGMKNVEILVKGQGSGRETAIRAIEGAGFDIISIQDITSSA
jgi:ribosomal protein S11